MNSPEPCESCRLIAERDRDNAPLWDCILRADYFDVVHVQSGSLPGWIVLVVRRHISAIDELTEKESLELGDLLRRVSLGLKEITGCEKTYVMQFAEAPGHNHVHFHVVPRASDMPENMKGANVFNYLREGEDVPETEKNRIAGELLGFLTLGKL